MNARWRAPAGLHTASARLPVEGELPSFSGATGWLNSPPLTPAGLRGKVTLIDFWTYTCINWLRQLPYVRAWAGKYSGHGLVVIGVHTPEFPFEHEVDNVRRAVKSIRVDYRSRSTTTTRYGVPSTITTGPRCTSPTCRGVSGITISAKASTSSRK
jgi:thiol-disulfide isomerase/thioredoxin